MKNISLHFKQVLLQLIVLEKDFFIISFFTFFHLSNFKLLPWCLSSFYSSSCTAHKQSFCWRISSGNVTKFAGNCGSGHIYQENGEKNILLAYCNNYVSINWLEDIVKHTVFFHWLSLIQYVFIIQHYVFMMLSAIWYHLRNLKNVKNTHGEALILVTQSNSPPWVFFTFFLNCKNGTKSRKASHLFSRLITQKNSLHNGKFKPMTFGNNI